MRRAPLAAVVLATALLAAPAPAAEPLGQARSYYDAGVRAYSAARYDVAVEAFREAYRLAPRETVLFSLAQAERRQFTVSRDPALLREAIAHYRKYLKEVAEGGRRADAVEALGELDAVAARMTDLGAAPAGGAEPDARSKLARIMISSLTAGATILLDGKASTEQTIIEAVTPGKHQVIVTAPGHADERREVTAVEGALVPVEITLRAKPSYLHVSAPAGARIAVDGQTIGEAPIGQDIEVQAGAHLVTVTRKGHVPQQVSVQVDRGEVAPVVVSLAQTAQRQVAFGVAGVVGATLIGGGILAGAALQAESEANRVMGITSAGNLSQSQLAQYNASLQLRDDLRSIAAVSFGVAAALGLVGAGLFIFDDPAPLRVERQNRSTPPRVSLVLSPGVAGLGVSGTF